MSVLARALLWMCSTFLVLPVWSETRAQEALTVSIAAPDYWCPYACDRSGSRLGFTVDIARAALEAGGHRVIYQNLPYDRALFEAERGRIDAVIPAFRDEAPGFIFPSQAVSLTEYCFYVPEGESWRYSGLDSLTGLHFVATSGYSYGVAMDTYIAAGLDRRVTLIQGNDVSARLRELVRRNRFDALLDDRLLFEFSQDSAGLSSAGCLEERHAGYLALSPENPARSNAIARALERGIKAMRDGGQLCEILGDYGRGVGSTGTGRLFGCPSVTD